MGTDIHGRIQFRYAEDAKYKDVGEIERDRNYNVFAMLAGVRNGVGFAGVKTHEPLVPISEPRGLPDDLETLPDDDTAIAIYSYDFVDAEEEQVRGRYWLGDHSHSWLTLTEINAWDGWGKRLACTGILEAAEFKRIEAEGGEPREWSGGCWGPSVVIVPAEEARAGKPHTHVRHEWTVPFVQYAGVFKAWLDYMTLKHGWLLKKDPDSVRIVFGFDS